MEINHELYAWLTSNGTISSSKSMKMKKNKAIILDEATVDKFRNAQINSLVLKLEEQYNKFYKSKLNYSERLHDLKQEDISTNSIRMYNWKILSQILNSFGLDIDESIYNKIISGNYEVLKEFLTTVHHLSEELSKRSNLIATEIKEEVNPNSSGKKIGSDTIELNQVSESKDLGQTETLLEFFLLSLCKSLNIKIRQAAGLLSDNRKFLIQVCNKGIKGDFSRVVNWYTALSFNHRHLLNLVKNTKSEGKTMTYATISCGLYSRNVQICVSTIGVINQLIGDIGSDFEWFFREGINAYLFCIMNHADLVVSLFNSMESNAKEKLPDLVKEITRRFVGDKDSLYDVCDIIIDKISKCNINIYQQIKSFIFENVISENRDRSRAVSIMCDAWITLYPDIDEGIKAQIISYLNKTLKDSSQRNVQMTALIHGFRLMNFLGKSKDENAPKLYKYLVFRIQENFTDVYYREMSLTHFLNAFQLDPNIPIDIMLRPYLQQFAVSQNLEAISLFDIGFIDKIMKCPRFNFDFIYQIIEIYFNLFLSHPNFSRLAHEKFNELVDKGLVTEDHFDLCAKFIKRSIGLFMKKPGETYVINMAFDIINLRISKINSKIEREIIDSNVNYRANHGSYSSSLLSMLWFYDQHDDVIMGLEEKYASRYDPVTKTVSNLNIPAMMKDHPHLNPKNQLEFIVKKREIEELKKKKIEEYKVKKQQKVNEELTKKMQERALELGKKNSLLGQGMMSSTALAKKQSNDRVDINALQKNSNNMYIFKFENNEYKFVINPQVRPEFTVLTKGLGIFEIKDESQRFDIENEEAREKPAIKALLKEYQKPLQFYFNKYLSDSRKQELSKTSLLKMIRDLGISDSLLSFDELSSIIRTQFNTPLNTLQFNQYVNVLTMAAYVIFGKVNKGNSVCQHFESFLDIMIIPKVIDNSKTVEKIKTFIISNSERFNRGELQLPPGFKLANKTKLNFDFSVRKDFIFKFLKESQIISLEIIDEIISRISKSHIIEPYIKITDSSDVSLTEKLPKWPVSIFKASMTIPKIYEEPEKNISEVLTIGNLMIDMLRLLDIGKSTMTKVAEPIGIEKQQIENLHSIVKLEVIKDKKRKLRQQFVKEQLVQMKQDLDEKKRKEKEDNDKLKSEKDKILRERLLKEKEERDKLKQDFENKRKQRKEEEVMKIRELRDMEEMKKKELKCKESEFLNVQRKKLKNQFKKLKEEKEKYEKMQEIFQQNMVSKINVEKVFLQKKSYFDFEKEMNGILENTLNEPEIQEIFSTYDNHLRLIYHIYSQIGVNKISVFHSDALHQKGFKEFSVDFMLMGLVITSEQLLYVFRKLCKRNNGIMEDQFYLKYEDFKIAIMYLIIYVKFNPKGVVEFNQPTVSKLNAASIRSFFDFLNLKIPFYKLELEQMINDRRALSAKERINVQMNLKKDKLGGLVEAERKPRVRRLKKIEKNEALNNSNPEVRNTSNSAGKLQDNGLKELKPEKSEKSANKLINSNNSANEAKASSQPPQKQNPQGDVKKKEETAQKPAAAPKKAK